VLCAGFFWFETEPLDEPRTSSNEKSNDGD